MGDFEAIEFLENLQQGEFCTVNLPLYHNECLPITVMYAGKDDKGRYNFIDKSNFILSKEFIEKNSIRIDKEFNQDEAFEIYSKVKLFQEKSSKNKNDLSK